MILLQRPPGHGRRPHIGIGQVLQDGELAAPLVHMDAAVRVRMPAQAAVLAAGQLEITVQDLHIAVQLGDIGHLALCQRAFPVGQQPVFKLHHRLPVQAVTVAVTVVVILVLLRVAQQGQMVAPPQHMVQSFHGAGFPDMHPQLLAV